MPRGLRLSGDKPNVIRKSVIAPLVTSCEMVKIVRIFFFLLIEFLLIYLKNNWKEK
jgi:hypothetical protein